INTIGRIHGFLFSIAINSDGAEPAVQVVVFKKFATAKEITGGKLPLAEFFYTTGKSLQCFVTTLLNGSFYFRRQLGWIEGFATLNTDLGETFPEGYFTRHRRAVAQHEVHDIEELQRS